MKFFKGRGTPELITQPYSYLSRTLMWSHWVIGGAVRWENSRARRKNGWKLLNTFQKLGNFSRIFPNPPAPSQKKRTQVELQNLAISVCQMVINFTFDSLYGFKSLFIYSCFHLVIEWIQIIYQKFMKTTCYGELCIDFKCAFGSKTNLSSYSIFSLSIFWVF